MVRVAYANGPYSINRGQGLTLNGSNSSDPDQSYGDSIVSYEWGLKADGTYEKNSSSPLVPITWTELKSYGLDSPGTYPVLLRVTDEYGETSSDTTTLAIINRAPIVNAGPDQTCNEGQLIFFTVSSYDPDYDPLMSFLWNFGDGSSYYDESCFSIAPHIYKDDGIYTETVYVSDGYALGSDSSLATVNNVAPIGNPGGPYFGQEGQSITFSAWAYDPGDDTITFEWDINNDGIYDYSGQSFSHFFADDYIGIGKLRISDEDGGWAESFFDVFIYNIPPQICPIADKIIDEGQEVQIPIGFFDPGSDPFEGTINFGDGSPEQPVHPAQNVATHTYNDDGVFTVTLTATDDDGGSTTITCTVTVNNISPCVKAMDDTSTLWGDELAFTARFTDPGADDSHTFSWNFGDGTSSGELNTIHTYNQPGTYTATLTVTNDDGGTGTDSVHVTVLKKDTFLSFTVTGGQYSDNGSVTAQLLSEDGSPVVGRKVWVLPDYDSDGNPDFKWDLGPTDENGNVQKDILLLAPQGNYGLLVIFEGDTFYNPSSDSGKVNVAKEQAAISYTGDTLCSYGSNITLSADIIEENDGSPGNIENASPVEFLISDEAGVYQTVVTGNTVETSPGIGRAVSTVSNLPTDVYKITIRLGVNGYYHAVDTEAVLVVYNPSGGFVTGGGWVMNGGKKSNLGFNAKYKADSSLQGEFSMIEEKRWYTYPNKEHFTRLAGCQKHKFCFFCRQSSSERTKYLRLKS